MYEARTTNYRGEKLRYRGRERVRENTSRMGFIPSSIHPEKKSINKHPRNRASRLFRVSMDCCLILARVRRRPAGRWPWRRMIQAEPVRDKNKLCSPSYPTEIRPTSPSSKTIRRLRVTRQARPSQGRDGNTSGMGRGESVNHPHAQRARGGLDPVWWTCRRRLRLLQYR